jgi:hypothetical protein
MKGYLPMNWKFWKKPPDQNGGKAAKTPKSAKPKALPQAIGRIMVVSMQLDPDMVWGLKYLSQRMEGKKNAENFRIFNPGKAINAGVAVKDWSSLDNRPELILYSGSYDKNSGSIDFG